MKVHFFSLILLTLITIPRAHTKEVNFLPTPETIDDADCIMKIDYRDLIIGDFSWDQVKAHVEGILTEKGYEVIFQDRTLQEIIAEGREHDQKKLSGDTTEVYHRLKAQPMPYRKIKFVFFYKMFSDDLFDLGEVEIQTKLEPLYQPLDQAPICKRKSDTQL